MLAPTALLALALGALATSHQQPFDSNGNTSPAFIQDTDGVDRYDGHEVWRINWSNLSDTSRGALYSVLEVSIFST